MAIRPATPLDWPAIWPFFREIVEARQTYAYPPDLTSDQAAALWFAEPPGTTVVATASVEGAERVVGSARMGPNRPGPGDHIGTASFMVDRAGRGHGIGRALGEYVIDWHRRNGYLGIQFNAVVETNTAAVRLWRSLGFAIVGTVPGAFRHPERGEVGLHVMFLPL